MSQYYSYYLSKTFHLYTKNMYTNTGIKLASVAGMYVSPRSGVLYV
jgi:hypothetical protein